MHEEITAVSDLKRLGFAVIPAGLTPAGISAIRALVVANLPLMGRTSAAEHFRHLAGFHRFETFAPITNLLAQNCQIAAALRLAFAPAVPEEIGLTDITVNRSQAWHTDLLRGPYAHFLAACDPWAAQESPCIKVLVHLQPGKSLRVLAGSHLRPSPLDDSAIAERVDPAQVKQLNLSAGDVVLLDLRSVHRGSTDAEMSDPGLALSPKILVSTVYGTKGSPFAQAMRRGNLARMADWDQKFLHLKDMAS